MLRWFGLAGFGLLACLPVWSELPARTGLEFTISELKQPGPKTVATPGQPRPAVPPTRLSASICAQILKRLVGVPVAKPGPAEPPPTGLDLPVPTSHSVTVEPFPPATKAAPPEASAAVPVRPLEVIEFGPKGGVETANALRIVFNQPMVPLAVLDKIDAVSPPVRLTPQPPGHWRPRTSRAMECGETHQTAHTGSDPCELDAGSPSD